MHERLAALCDSVIVLAQSGTPSLRSPASPIDLGTVLHMWEMSGEYDYQLDAGSEKKRDEIVSALQYAHVELMNTPLCIKDDMDAKAAETGMLTKPLLKERAKSISPQVMSDAIASRRSLVMSLSSSKRSLATDATARTPTPSSAGGGVSGGAGAPAGSASISMRV